MIRLLLAVLALSCFAAASAASAATRPKCSFLTPSLARTSIPVTTASGSVVFVVAGSDVTTASLAVHGSRAANDDGPRLRVLPLVRPIASSTLFTLPNADVRTASLRANNVELQALAIAEEDKPVLPDALVVRTARNRLGVVWYPSSERMRNLHILERLYHLVLRQPAVNRFDFHVGEGIAVVRDGSHARVLETIANARACVTAQLELAHPMTWETVVMHVMPRTSSQKSVSIRAVDHARRPVTRAHTTFTRGPHLSCSAATDHKGVATCLLEDMHQDDDDDGMLPTVAVFSGVVTADRIYLPTTAVWKHR